MKGAPRVASPHLPVTIARLKNVGLAGTSLGMSRICLILLALVLAVVTTAVPVNRAAKAFGNDGGVPRQDVVAQEVSAQRATSAPIKRCQSGAGMLACPFQNPAMAGVDIFLKVASVPYLSLADPALTGRSVPAPLRPPKRISA